MRGPCRPDEIECRVRRERDWYALDYYERDTGNIEAIPPFIKQVLKDHPEVDCLVNNARVQRPFQVLGRDYDFDLGKADQEIDINVRGTMHLTLGFLPHLNEKPSGGVIMNISSVLGYNPTRVLNSVYNGTEAWLLQHECSDAIAASWEQSDNGGDYSPDGANGFTPLKESSG